MQSIADTLALLQRSDTRAGAESLREAEFLRQANDGQATAEIALLLAEAESKILQTPSPDKDLLRSLGKLREEAARDL